MSRNSILLFVAFIAITVNSVLCQTPVSITVDATVVGEPLKPVWQYYGYDECNYTNTTASKLLLDTLVHMNYEKVYIRTHFLLNSTSGAPGLKWGSTDAYSEDALGQPVYNWIIMDSIMDAITQTGALPLVEIGFMPKSLTVATVAYRNSTVTANDGGDLYPPKDYTKWSGLVEAWARHSNARYSNVETTWLWEMWNEPQWYFKGTATEFNKMYDYAEQGFRKALPNGMLGGPDNYHSDAFFKNYLTHCATGTNLASGVIGTRLDLATFHAKGGVAMYNSHVRMDLGNQLRVHRAGFDTIYSVPAHRNTPIIIGEADPDGCAACPVSQYPQDAYRNVPAYGAYEIAMMKHTIDLAKRKNMNLKGVLTWAWLFNGQPYFQGYRTLSTNGIHKPVLNAFKMLCKLRGNRVTLVSSGARGLDSILASGVRGTKPDIDGLAVKQGDTTVRVLLWNYHDDLVPVNPDSIRLSIQLPAGFPGKARITHYRMDTTHSNAYTKWVVLGKPQSPTAAQLDTLKKSMLLEMLEPIKVVDIQNSTLSLSFAMPRFAVSLVQIEGVPSSATKNNGGNSYNPRLPVIQSLNGGIIAMDFPQGTTEWSLVAVNGKVIATKNIASVSHSIIRCSVRPGIYIVKSRCNGTIREQLVTSVR